MIGSGLLLYSNALFKEGQLKQSSRQELFVCLFLSLQNNSLCVRREESIGGKSL